MPIHQSLQIIHLFDRLDRVQKRASEMVLKSVEAAHQRFERLTEEKLEAGKLASKRGEQGGFWGALQKIVAFVSSTLSILAGVFVAPASPILGGCLIASGILSLANIILEDTGGWDAIAEKIAGEDEKKRVFLRQMLPMILSTLLIGFNILGAPILWQQMELLAVLNSAGQITSGTLAIGKGIFDANSQFEKSHQVDIDNRHKAVETHTTRLSRHAEHHHALHGRSTQFLKRIVRGD